MPHAARITDAHTCPAHGGGPVHSGCATVNIGFQRAARVGDVARCGGPSDAIAQGARNVYIGFQRAARVGDPTVHGGQIVSGCPTVNIGTTAQASALASAAEGGVPFCEACERAKKLANEQAEELEQVDAEPPPGAATEPLALASADTSTAALLAPSAAERALAAAQGSSLEHRVAREKVVRHFYAEHERDGLGEARADQDLGVGGRPPRPNASPLGFGIDLRTPVERIPIPDAPLEQQVGPAGHPGNAFLLPGAAASPADRVRSFRLPSGEGLGHTAGPTVGSPADPSAPADQPGGQPSILVPDSLRKRARCVCCNANPCPR